MSAAMSGPSQRSGPGGPAAPPPWVPKTELGRRVAADEITSMAAALESGLPLREPQIVDKLLPGLHDEVLDVNMVQRMTDSGPMLQVRRHGRRGQRRRVRRPRTGEGSRGRPDVSVARSTARSSRSSRSSEAAAAGNAAAAGRIRFRSRSRDAWDRWSLRSAPPPGASVSRSATWRSRSSASPGSRTPGALRTGTRRRP